LLPSQSFSVLLLDLLSSFENGTICAVFGSELVENGILGYKEDVPLFLLEKYSLIRYTFDGSTWKWAKIEHVVSALIIIGQSFM
jgi:hypothetical protein